MWIKVERKSYHPPVKKTPKQQQLQRKNLYLYTTILLNELNIDNKTKQEMLFSMFEKWSRKQLTLTELEHFAISLEQMRDRYLPKSH